MDHSRKQESPASHPKRPEAPLPILEEPIDLTARLAFLSLGDQDRVHLAAISRRMSRDSDAFVEQFYAHLFRFEETAQFLRDPQLVASLKQRQKAHLESMLAAHWDEAYLARHLRVGDAHAQVGINPHMFLGAYNQYLQFCFRRLAAPNAEMQAFAEQMLSLLKVVLLDIGLSLDAYFQQATQNLREALNLVFQANTELRQFAQFTSHDLKTPLATVANLCDEVLDEFAEELPSEAQKLIDQARQRAFSMSRTIDELLKSTISLSTKVELDEVPSGEVIHEAVDQVRPQLEEKQIELTSASQLPWVMGDRVRIREAFYNLLSNAAKFIDKTPGRITIDVDLRGQDCIFAVRDNGPGIPREEWERVFVPFRRLPTHREQPGSGLGLYFAKSVIEAQGGRLWVESELGEGSCFYVLLKRPPGAAARD